MFENNKIIICRKTEAGGREAEGFRIRGRRLWGKGAVQEQVGSLLPIQSGLQKARGRGQESQISPGLSERLAVPTG